MSRALAVAALSVLLVPCAWPGIAAAAPKEQQHEVGVSIDLSVARAANAALINARYTFTPSGIDRSDEVVPLLRRFVRHPSSAWIHVLRDGQTIETRTGISGGGTAHVLDGRLYGEAEIGIHYVDEVLDPLEEGFYAVPMRAEVGGRPTELLALGVSYSRREVVSAADGRNAANRPVALRDGADQLLEGVLTLSTPGDRLLLTMRGGWYDADWSFTRTYEGDMKASGPRGSMVLSFQGSSRLSWQLRAEASRLEYQQLRMGIYEESDDFPLIIRPVYDILADVGLQYWHRGEVGLRVSFGGGFIGKTPTYLSEDRAVVRMSIGVAMRF